MYHIKEKHFIVSLRKLNDDCSFEEFFEKNTLFFNWVRSYLFIINLIACHYVISKPNGLFRFFRYR